MPHGRPDGLFLPRSLFMIPKRAKTFGNKATLMYPFWIELSVEHLAQVLVAAVATAGWVTNWLMGMR